MGEPGDIQHGDLAPMEHGEPGDLAPTEPGDIQHGDLAPMVHGEPGEPGDLAPMEPGEPGDLAPTEPGEPGDLAPMELGGPGECDLKNHPLKNHSLKNHHFKNPPPGSFLKFLFWEQFLFVSSLWQINKRA